MSLRRKIKDVLAHGGFRRYLFNTSWMFAERILRLVAGVFVGVWVARYLGPEQFGVFSYAVAFVAIFGAIAKLGLDDIVVRDLVKVPNEYVQYLGTAFWLKLLGGLITVLVVALATLFTDSDSTTNLYIFIISSGIVFQSFEVIDFYFQSKVLSKFISVCRLIQLILSSVLKIYLVLAGADLIWFVLVSLVDVVTVAVALNIAYKMQRINWFYKSFNFNIAKQLLSNSWPLVFSGLVIMIYMRIDQIMIKEMMGAKEVGLYSAAVKLSEVWYFIPMIIANSLFPSIINAKNNNVDIYQSRIKRLYSFMIWLAIIIAIPTTFLSDWIITLLYGEAYKVAGEVLVIQIWAGVFVFLGVASGRWLTSENLQMFALIRSLSGVVVNITLNLILIPRFGLVGAAMATVIAQAVASFFVDMLSSKTRPDFIRKIKSINPKYTFIRN